MLSKGTLGYVEPQFSDIILIEGMDSSDPVMGYDLGMQSNEGNRFGHACLSVEVYDTMDSL